MTFGVSTGGAYSPMSVGIDAMCPQRMSSLSNKSLTCLSSLDVQILKYDVLTKSTLKWGQEHCWPAEPLFIPRPGATDEDDGKTPGRGAPACCTLPVITPQSETSFGSNDPPSTHPTSHCWWREALKPRSV